MSKYLLDTDVIIECLKENQKVILFLKAIAEKDNAFVYSPVTKAEIFHGIRKGEERKVETLFRSMQCIPATEETGEKAGYYLKQFHLSHNLQMGDAFVAAAAHSAKAILLTFNKKHYPMKDIEVIIP